MTCVHCVTGADAVRACIHTDTTQVLKQQHRQTLIQSELCHMTYSPLLRFAYKPKQAFIIGDS